VKKSLIRINNEISEDLVADDLWQPYFEARYPDIHNPIGNSRFRKFKVEDILRE
jgi:hypothetical protein